MLGVFRFLILSNCLTYTNSNYTPYLRPRLNYTNFLIFRSHLRTVQKKIFISFKTCIITLLLKKAVMRHTIIAIKAKVREEKRNISEIELPKKI